MTSFSHADDLRGARFDGVSLRDARFTGVNLRGARIAHSDLSGLVLRGVDVAGLDLDSPWLSDGTLLVNGVDVVGFVEAELARRSPGRDLRRATDPDGLRAAWAAVSTAWDTTVTRVAAMPDGTVDVAVDGEWSFAQTLRHLVLATDLWLGKAVLGLDRPFHPLGLAHEGAGDDGLDMSVFTTATPTYAEVLAARADRVAMVRDFLAEATSEVLAQPRINPWNPEHPETVCRCLHTILEEEWEHHRFAVRDLEAIEARPSD